MQTTCNTTRAILEIAARNYQNGYLTWVADSGHEWLLVPAREVDPARVSPFSYVHSEPTLGGNWYALEGDCDAAQMFERDTKPETREIYIDGDACIRAWASAPRGKASTPISTPAGA